MAQNSGNRKDVKKYIRLPFFGRYGICEHTLVCCFHLGNCSSRETFRVEDLQKQVLQSPAPSAKNQVPSRKVSHATQLFLSGVRAGLGGRLSFRPLTKESFRQHLNFDQKFAIYLLLRPVSLPFSLQLLCLFGSRELSQTGFKFAVFFVLDAFRSL